MRLDVDDDVGVWERSGDRGFDGVCRGVALSDGRAGRHADHHVCELTASRLAHADAPQLDRRRDQADGGQRRRLRIRRRPVHQHVHIRLHQPCRRSEDEHSDEERRDRVALRMTLMREDEADEHCERSGKIAAEVQCVRRQRGTSVTARRAPRDERPADVDRDHDAENDERVPRRVHLAVHRAGEPLDRAHRDEHAGDREDRRLAECRQVLRLAVSELMRHVGGPRGDANREVRQQSGNEVRARVHGFRDQAEAVGGETDTQLQDDEHRSRCDGDKR